MITIEDIYKRVNEMILEKHGLPPEGTTRTLYRLPEGTEFAFEALLELLQEKESQEE